MPVERIVDVRLEFLSDRVRLEWGVRVRPGAHAWDVDRLEVRLHHPASLQLGKPSLGTSDLDTRASTDTLHVAVSLFSLLQLDLGQELAQSAFQPGPDWTDASGARYAQLLLDLKNVTVPAGAEAGYLAVEWPVVAWPSESIDCRAEIGSGDPFSPWASQTARWQPELRALLEKLRDVRARVFVSYSRHDGRDLAARLRAELARLGCQVWQDVVSQDAGESWWPNIIQAIEGSQVMILVVTPRALRSQVVRDEWLHARRVGTAIVPVVGDHTLLHQQQPDGTPLLPRWLTRLDVVCLDPSDPDHEAHWQRLLKAVAEPGAKRPLPFSVPRMLRQYVPRAEQEQALRNRLLAEDGLSPRAARVALVGHPGFGKTTLAQAVCGLPEVVEAYRDGIFWLVLGERAAAGTVLQRLNSVVQALGGAPSSELDEACRRYQDALDGRDCLIVLEDVWQETLVERFLPATGDAPRPRRCTQALLITSRGSDVARHVSAREDLIRMPEMTSDEATDMLASFVPEVQHPIPGGGRRVLYGLARGLGEWPLLLGIVGLEMHERLIRGESLDQAVAGINQGLAEEGFQAFDRPVDESDPAQRNRNLNASLSLSLRRHSPEEQQRLLELSIFPDDTKVPVAAAERLWARDGHLSKPATDKLLRAFDGPFLALDLGSQTFAFHDVLRRCLAERLGADAQRAAHQALLEGYNPEGKPWAEVGLDAYMYEHLAYHLRAAGRGQDLEELLTSSSDWMERKFAVSRSDASYVADLELVLGDFTDPVPPERLSVLVALHSARQVVHARVSRYQDVDLQVLVWLGRMPEALSHARLRAESQGRYESLMAIHVAQRQRRPADAGLLAEALRVAHSIPAFRDRVEAMRKVALALAQAGQFDEAGACARGIESPLLRAKAMRGLASALAQAGRFEEAGACARGIEDQRERSWAIRELALALAQAADSRAGGLFEEAGACARGIEDKRGCAEAMTGLALALAQAGDSSAGRVFDEAEVCAQGIEDLRGRAEAMRDLAIALAQASRFWEAGASARGIKDDDKRAKAMRELALALAQAGDSRAAGMFEEATACTRRIGDPRKRAKAVRELVVALAQAGRFEEARAWARGIEDPRGRSRAARELAMALAQVGRFDEAGACARGIEDPLQRSKAVRELAMALAQVGRFDEAGACARGIEDQRERSWAMRELALVLAQAGDSRAGGVFDEARACARGIDNEEKRAKAMRGLAVALAQARRFEEAGACAGGIEDPLERAEAMRDLAIELARAGRFEEAEACARGIEDPLQSAKAMRRLAMALAQAGCFEEAAVCARDIKDERERAETMRESALALAQAGDWRAREVFEEAGACARGIGDPRGRSKAVSELAMALAQVDRFDEAGACARGIDNEEQRAKAMRDLAVALAQAGRFEEAGACVQGIEDSLQHAKARRGVTLALARVGRLEEAEACARGIKDPLQSAKAMRDLAIALARADRFEEAEACARGIGDSLQRAKAVKGLTLALAQAGRFEEAEAHVPQIEDQRERAEAMVELALTLAQAGRFEEAEACARGIKDRQGRTEALRKLAMALAQAGRFEEARACARAMRNSQQHAEAIRVLAVALAQAGRFQEAGACAQGINNEEQRAEAMRQLAMVLAQVGRFEEARSRARGIQDDKRRAKAMRELALALAQAGDSRAGGAFEEAGACARGIGHEEKRAKALKGLALALAQAGRVAAGLCTYGPQSLDQHLTFVVNAFAPLAHSAPAYFVRLLCDAVRIVGWVRADWARVYESLAAGTFPRTV